MNWVRKVQDNLYGDLFTMEIRMILSTFLSKHEKGIFTTSSKSKEVQKFIQDLKNELSILVQRLSTGGGANLIYKFLMKSQNQNFQEADPSLLFQLIQKTLENERKIIQELDATSSQSMDIDDEVQETSHSVEAPKLETQFEKMSRGIQSALTEVEIKSADICTRLLTKVASPNETIIALDALSFNQEICNILDELTKIHGYVLSELDNFRDEQRHVSLGKSSDKKLEDFEKWFCRLLLLFQDLEEIHIPQLELLSELTSLLQDTLRPQSLQQTKDQIKALRLAFFKNGYVIEDQPKQIILQGVNFGGIKLRVLPWPRSHSKELIVSPTVTFIDESTARKIINGELPIITEGPNQIESLATLKSKLDSDSKAPQVEVKNENIIEYPKILATNLLERSDKNDSNRRVSQKRFYLFFTVTVTWKGESYKMVALSLPIYYTTHGSQDKYSWTDMVYYNSIPRQYHNGIVTSIGPVPNTIPWSDLVEGIDQLFVGLGRKLSAQQRAYFKQKLCQDHINDTTVSMEKFYDVPFGKIEGPKTDTYIIVAFGQWLYHCVEILSLAPCGKYLNPKPLRYYYANGAILGFLTTEDIVANLKDRKEPGTFVIRFPEMMAGEIGLYWYSAQKAEDTYNKNPCLKQLINIEYLNTKPLQDIILESDGTLHLYSNYKVDKPERGRGSVFHKTEIFEASTPKKAEKPKLDENGYFKTTTKEQEYFPTELLKQINLSKD